MKPQTLDTLQVGRGVAALAVLLYHVNDTLALPKYLGRETASFFHCGNSGVQYFFVLSGFVLYLAHRRDFGRPEKLGAFVWKRFRRIYPPLWAVLLCVIPIYFLIPSLGKGGETDPAAILSAFLISPSLHDPLLVVEWTLRREVVFYCVFAFALWNRKGGAVVAALWLLGSVLFSITGQPSVVLSSYNFLFAMGFAASVLYSRGFNRYPKGMIVTGCILFFATWFVLWQYPDNKQHYVLVNCAYGLGATLAMLGGAVLERNTFIRVPRALVFLGEASYSVYLAHYPVISAATKFLTPLSRRFSLPDFVLVGLIAIIALVAGLIFHVVVEKRLLSLLPNQLPTFKPAYSPTSV